MLILEGLKLMMVSPHLEAMSAWIKTQQMTVPELSDLDVRPCRVSAFRQAQEVVLSSGPRIGAPLIISCFGSKVGAFSTPVLYDLDDPLRKLAVDHANDTIHLFKELVDKEVQLSTHHATFFKQHLNVVAKASVEITVLSVDRNHLTVLAWHQGERELVSTVHTYDLKQLILREHYEKIKVEPTPYAELKASNEFITDAFVNLLKTKRPNRRTLPHASILAYCARILRNSGPGLKGFLSTTFEEDILKVNYEAESISIHFRLLDELPTGLTGNYEPIATFHELDNLLEQQGKQDHDLVWHFSRLPTRFNNKPSKRAIAYTKEQNSLTFYHPFEKLYLQISVHC
jgi:hypothetical protein